MARLCPFCFSKRRTAARSRTRLSMAPSWWNTLATSGSPLHAMVLPLAHQTTDCLPTFAPTSILVNLSALAFLLRKPFKPAFSRRFILRLKQFEFLKQFEVLAGKYGGAQVKSL